MLHWHGGGCFTSIIVSFYGTFALFRVDQCAGSHFRNLMCLGGEICRGGVLSLVGNRCWKSWQSSKRRAGGMTHGFSISLAVMLRAVRSTAASDFADSNARVGRWR